MFAQHENRTGKDRRQLNPAANLSLEIERRWNKDQRSHTVNEAVLYQAGIAQPEDYWETLSSIPSEDYK